MLKVRLGPEGKAGGIAAVRASAPNIERPVLAVSEMQQARDGDDEGKLVAADLTFHNGVALAAGSVMFSVTLDTLVGLVREFMHKTYSRYGPHRAIGNHQEILEAVRRRDADGARRAMRIHMEATLLCMQGLEAAAARRVGS